MLLRYRGVVIYIYHSAGLNHFLKWRKPKTLKLLSQLLTSLLPKGWFKLHEDTKGALNPLLRNSGSTHTQS